MAALGKSLINHYDKNTAEISISNLVGKKRPLKMIKNIEIVKVPAKKRRKADKSEKGIKKDRRKENDVIEHNTAFAQVMPFLLSEEMRLEFSDSYGNALNESAIISEQLLIADSVADFDLRYILNYFFSFLGVHRIPYTVNHFFIKNS